MAVKNGVLRRALYALVLLVMGLCLYLYYAQGNTNLIDVDTVFQRIHQNQNNDDRMTIRKRFTESQWTWVCASDRCEKRERSKEPFTSLETCNMLCKSTQLWPQPTGLVEFASHFLTFTPNQFKFEAFAPDLERALLEKAYEIFKLNVESLLANRRSNYLMDTDLDNFLIKAVISQRNQTVLKIETDESYNLTIRPSGRNLIAIIKAKTFFGARHGLETLSQLIWSDETDDGSLLRILKGASLQDAPKFAYRGLMLDTGRHFFPVAAIKRMLIGMAANKLNVFHWHVSDSQSFPLDAPSVPQMAKYGASSPDMTYSVDDVRDLVEFARVRGIRVLMEIDAPAHAGNGWNWGPQEDLGDLAVCVNQQPWNVYCGEPPCGQLNPTNPNTYKVLESLYRDILDMTQEREFFHMGGDEVNFNCWEQLQNKITNPYNYTDMYEIWGQYINEANKRLQLANNGHVIPNVIVWSSPMTNKPYMTKYLNKHTTIVQSWGVSTWAETSNILDAGYRLIISHVDAWYLDCGFGKWRETGEAACDPYRTWQTIYNHRPWQKMRLTDETKSQIVGGEACLWTEQVDEGTLDSRLWPRAAAFAERLWSDSAVNYDTREINEDVYTRLSTQRERLVKRGLGAEAFWPKWCVQNPGMCL